jgi:PEP-CTERM motif
MPQTRRIALTIAAFLLLFLLSTHAKADPLFFSNVVALQNGGMTQVDLFSNPGVTLLGPQVTFLVDVTGILPAGGSDTLLITYNEAGSAPIVQSFSIPFFGTIPPPFTLVFRITSPGATIQGTMASLTLDLLGSSPDFIIPSGPNAGQRVNSYTYSFKVAQVPEPTSVLLLSTGLFGVATQVRRKLKKR